MKFQCFEKVCSLSFGFLARWMCHFSCEKSFFNQALFKKKILLSIMEHKSAVGGWLATRSLHTAHGLYGPSCICTSVD